MDIFLEFLKNAVIPVFLAIVNLIRGDKKVRIEKEQKMNEFRSISFDFLVHVLRDYWTNADNTPVCRGSGVDSLIGSYRQEFAKHKPYMTRFEKRKYQKYVRIAHNYYQHWEVLISTNRSDKDVELVLCEQQELLKHISWLGEQTGREQEANNLKKKYE